jgi:hypothetical protein
MIAFTVADRKNYPHALKLQNSFHKFHPDIELKIYTDKDIKDNENYYRQKPMFARELIKDHEVVLGLDADQIITGSLDYIFEQEYDAAVVMNFNRVDPPIYGPVSILDVPPTEYMNCGLVAMRSVKFIKHWWNLCNSYHFRNMQYREQDLLNILVHYGNYHVECLDFPDLINNYHAWHGLIAKGEYNKVVLRDGKLILPKADDNYPEQDKEIKVLHLAGGGNEKKIGDTYRLYFNEEVIKYIDGLVA